MHPPRLSQLRWLKPYNMEAAEFAELKPRLINAVERADKREVYSVNTRSIYTVDDQRLGSTGIKELRFETPWKRFQAATLRKHRVLCEFNAAACFATRGGHTPKLYGAAIEGGTANLQRLFIFMDWLDNCSTLSESITRWTDDEMEGNIANLAQSLVYSASCGLVHGRHSSENILMSEDGRFNVIDFSHAQLFRTFNTRGFVHDVGRIGARLKLENACDNATVITLFRAVVSAAARSDVTQDRLAKQFENILQHSKKRQRIARNYRTFWRGLPSRLRV